MEQNQNSKWDSLYGTEGVCQKLELILRYWEPKTSVPSYACASTCIWLPHVPLIKILVNYIIAAEISEF
jgi:hypothetical protein